MLASYNWLRELSGIDASPAEYGEKLTTAGLELEAVHEFGAGLEGVVIAEVRGKRKHPEREKLSLVTVYDGEEEQEVVCGAPNVPDAGGRVLFARLGAELPGGFAISPRKIGGIVSSGMICSESELEIGEGTEGIFICGEDIDAAVGTPVVEALSLRDTVLEIGITPNRPDCLGHIGLARELCLLFGQPFELPATPAYTLTGETLDVEGHGTVSVSIEEPERCPRYGAMVVRGIEVGPSPFWLRYRLHCLGLRSISNAVDVTNLILMEAGHPIHGFDLERVRGRRIEVRLAKADETMSTLDDVERHFETDDLLICDGEGPVAVAGVMGGLDSEIESTTRDVLIECAYFNPRSVRRTARRLGLKTDSSFRFERGVDPEGVPFVLSRAATILQSVCGGKIDVTGLDVYPAPVEPKTIRLRYADIDALMGHTYSRERVHEILTGLGCQLTTESDTLEAIVPTGRPDLSRDVDLIEEVARVHGYQEIPVAFPRIRPTGAGTAPELLAYRRLREAGAAVGLHEAINYAFVSESDLDSSRAPVERLRLANALSEERSVMRTSLMVGLVHAAGRALRRQADSVTLFELANTYHPCGEPLPRERMRLGILLVGARPGWIGTPGDFDIYDAKSALSGLLRVALSCPVELRSDDGLGERAPYLHPSRRAAVWVGDSAVGVLGEVHPEVVDSLPIEGRPIYAEVDVEGLLKAVESLGRPKAKDLPKFPMVRRDIAMVVAEGVEASTIAATLLEAAGGLAESAEVFDLYRGEHVPAGHKSLAFRVVYRDPEATLTDKKVEKVHAKLGRAVKERFTATLR